ncbi:hypothetical protein ONE63_011454 [Megalurothrips usitatus]|uniref:ATP-dependent DNA helicase n=1 Tax=Megalurothrips usitatus TaxID=439358 RepID=A0AAV7X308_9NEOP|nr:hypothetical protein ONE63_011454 [Megalurothrips usitatus]
MAMAFPALFPHGTADFRAGRRAKLDMGEYVKFLMEYHDGRFAKHPTFRFFLLNSWLRWRALSIGRIFVINNPQFRNMTAVDLREAIDANPNVVKQVMFYGSKVPGTRPFWQARSGELQDMCAQRGMGTLFCTFSSPDHWLRDFIRLVAPDEDAAVVTEARRFHLLNENPLIANTFFCRRAKLLMFEIFTLKHEVEDYWFRFEWQHRGSPHIHCIVWLRGAPDRSDLAHATPEHKQAVVDYFDGLVSTVNTGRGWPPAAEHPSKTRYTEVRDYARDLGELLNRVQMHRCGSYCLRKDKCRFKFPKPLEEVSRLAQDDKGHWVLYTLRNDELINSFMVWATQLWRGNTDATPISDMSLLCKYIAKYSAKAEIRSKSCAELMAEILADSNDDADAKSVIQRLLIKAVSERDYSAQESCHILTQESLVMCSRTFVVLNLSKNQWVELQEPDQGAAAAADVAEDADGGDVDVEAAADAEADGEADGAPGGDAPAEPEGEGEASDTFPAFVHKYTKRPRHGEMANMSLFQVAQNHKPRARGQWSKYRKEAVVRVFPRLKLTTDEEANEDYYRVQVLLHVPWRREAEFDDFASWKDAFDFHGVTPIGGVDMEAGVVAAAVEVAAERAEEGELEPDEQELDEWMVNGKAGSGKSTVIEGMRYRIWAWGAGRKRYLLMAPTAIAAVHIDAQTIHSTLKIAPQGEFKELQGDTLRKFQEAMQDVEFLIIDEFSMLGCKMLGYIDRRMRQGKPDSDEPFGGCYVYLLGDIRQLPPVGDPPLYTGIGASPDVQRGILAYKGFQKSFILSVSQRQADNGFRDALDRLSLCQITDEDFALFESRFALNVALEEREMFRDAPHLHFTRDEVLVRNVRKTEELNPPVARVPAKHNVRAAEKYDSGRAQNLEPVLYLAKGSKVMLRTNLWTEMGLVNGALGTVVDIVYAPNKSPPEDPPAVVMVRFDSYRGPTLADGLVPVPSMVRGWEVGSASYSREQFPLTVAYSSTVHKVQGLTKDRAVVTVGANDFAVGLMYVGISRVKTLEGLLLDVEFTKQRANAGARTDAFRKRMTGERNILRLSRVPDEL